jgi:hypothetical protein
VAARGGRGGQVGRGPEQPGPAEKMSIEESNFAATRVSFPLFIDGTLFRHVSLGALQAVRIAKP